ncbi:MAG: lysoplasmalogenase family protein [Burkholderiales bacterium]
MRFVFLALMCVFAGIHAARSAKPPGAARTADLWDAAGRLFFRIAASLMFVLIAVASRTGVKHQAYYVLVLVGLCISLASDVLLGFTGVRRDVSTLRDSGFQSRPKDWGVRSSSIASAFAAITGAVYIGAFYSYAAFSWYDAAFFVVLFALACAVIYNAKRDMFKSAVLLMFILLLCAVFAKALSLLFVPSRRYVYACLAAAGAALFAAYGAMRILPAKNGKYTIAQFIAYYIGQALIALSVMI